MNRKILIGIVSVFILVAIGVATVLLTKPDSNNPIKSHVPQGDVIQPNANQGNGGQPGADDDEQTASDLSKPPTTAELSVTIQKSTDYLSKSNGQPAFSIAKVAKPLKGWYVVTIVVNGQRGKIILKQTNDPNNPLTVVAGPGTYFPPEDFSFPDEVRKAL